MTARRGALVLAGILLVSLAFRLHVSRECSLWLDEVLTHLGVLKSWPKVLHGPSAGHPPLMYVLVKGATRLFGTGETGLRSVSLLFGCFLLAAVYELCLELGLSVWRALIVVATFALTPFFLRHATEARHYALLTTFATLAMTRALRLVRGSQRARDLLGFAGCIVAAAATHYFGLAYALALLGLVTVGVGLGWKQASVRWRIAVGGVLVGSLLPLGYFARRAIGLGHSFGVGQGDDAAAVPAFNSNLLRDIPLEFSFLATDASWWLALQPALAAVGLVLLSRRLGGVARLLPLGLGLAPCAAALFLASQHFVAPRYLAPSAILYHLGACHALFALVERVQLTLSVGGRAAWLAPHVGWPLLIGLLAARLMEYPKEFGAGGDDYRGLQRYFLASLADDTALVAYPGHFGKILLSREYKMGTKPIALESFKRVKRINRYLVVEIHGDTPERRAELESLATSKLGVSPDAWRALPLVPLPHSRYQTAVNARLVELPTEAPRHKRKRRKRRHHKPPTPAATATPAPAAPSL